MSSDDRELTQFAENFRQEIINNSEGSGDDGSGDSFREDEFTKLMIEYLTEAGELEDGHVCYHKAHGMKINGYSVFEEDCLDLFISIYTQSVPPVTVSKSDVETAFRRLIASSSPLFCVR